MYSQNNGMDKSGNGLIIAFANLFFRLNIDPIELNLFENNSKKLDMISIVKLQPGMSVAERGVPGTWPKTNNAIVKFRRFRQNGRKTDHYCLVADANFRSIIDSLDGKIKLAKAYGEPLDWVSYAYKPEMTTMPEPVVIKPKRSFFNKPKLGSTYKTVEYDNFWDVCRRLNVDPKIMIEHNEIADPNDIPVGTELHVPITKPTKEERVIKYELLPEVRKMHVSRPGGAKKWSFGNVTDWKDVTSAGHYIENSNVEIVAVAHVPIGDDTAAYYMDTRSLGEYSTTGLVAFTTGFNWRDLADGHVERVDTPPPVAEAKIEEQKVVEPEPEPEPEKPDPGLHTYKTTFKGFETPVMYIARETIMVQEMDTRRPDRALYNNQAVAIAGTFTKGGVLYGRPKGSVDNGYWFGIPMSNLIAEDELYDTTLTLPDRVALKRLTPVERYWWTPLARTLSHYTKFVGLFSKKTKE